MSTEPIIAEVVEPDRLSPGSPIELESSHLGNQRGAVASGSHASTTFILLPVVVLAVTLLGGVRLAPDNGFVFLRPQLICLVLAAISIAILSRVGLVRVGDWVSNDFSLTKNLAASALLFALFTATVQVFNSLLPEQGLAFWVIGFCLFWTLLNNLFSTFDVKRLMRSLGVLFGMAFVVKYVILANLTAPSGGSWLSRAIENPGQEALTWFLDLPRFGPGTGYIQFFTIAFYLLALYITPPSLRK